MLSLILSVVVSFAIAILAGFIIIPVLKKMKAGQQVRDDGPKTHLVKAGTPTMGGFIILIAVIAAALIFSGKSMSYTLFAIACMMIFALVGFWDDFIKLFKKRSLGLRAYQKLLLQVAISIGLAVAAYYIVGPKIIIPFSGKIVDMGIGFIPFTAFVIISMVNSVNLTDGLDGLAAGVTLVDAIAFTIIFCLLAGIRNFSSAISNHDMFSMMTFSAALAGACVGFLCFNKYPAKVFMGDTGAFALGGALSAMGILSGYQLLLPIIGIMFVLSSISVIIQVGSYKLRKKRVFKMAPLHHHFELSGMRETKVVAMYVSITAALCAISLLLL